MPGRKPSPPHLYLIDGHSLIYRAYFAIRGLSTSKGVPTNAAYGFTNMLLKLFREKQPQFLAIAFDSKGPTQRHEEYAEYKAQRPEMPDPLQQQIPIIHQIVSAFRIPVLMMEGYEADDLIGTLSKHAEKEGMEVTIVTGDKDLFQLIGPKVQVYDTMKDKTYREEDVHQRFGVEPTRIVEIMGLMGDSVDNIPGVPGVGEKTATKLIREFQTIDNLLGNLDRISQPKLRASLKQHSDLARMSRHLATLRLDCPINLTLSDYERKSSNVEKVTELFRELEFTGLLKQLDELQIGHMERAPGSLGHGLEPIRYEIVTDQVVLGSLIDRIRNTGQVVIEPFPRENWISVSVIVDGQPYNIPIRNGKEEGSPRLTEKVVLSALGNVLSDPKIKLLGHHLKGLVLDCMNRNLTVQGLEFDTEIASYLLNPSRRDHSLETAALEHLGRSLKSLPKLDRDKPIDADQIGAILAARGESVKALSHKMTPMLEEQELLSLFREIEMPLIPVLARMEQTGIKINSKSLNKLSDELHQKLRVMVNKIYAIAGQEFNINSPKQLSKVLFEDLGLTPIKRTKTGYSTNEEVLQQLSVEHELPTEILNYRHLSKLKSTYVDALPQLVNPRTGRLHTSFNQTGTATGRLSSSDPNLQNIPIRGEWGKRIRSAFITEEGHQLMSFDYNQVELRILAHVSGDERLTTDFKEGTDVHTSTASKIFGVATDAVTSDMRRTAKSVNFGIVYGISPYGLSTTLGIPQNEAKQYIDSYFSYYPGVRRFIDETIDGASKQGYVTTLLHRRRPIAELGSQNRATRGFGERTAVNTVIQGSAADLIKVAMIRITEKFRKESIKSRLLLQIHDELIFEVPDSETDQIKQFVKAEMEGAFPLRVPIIVDYKMGKSWGTTEAPIG